MCMCFPARTKAKLYICMRRKINHERVCMSCRPQKQTLSTSADEKIQVSLASFFQFRVKQNKNTEDEVAVSVQL